VRLGVLLLLLLRVGAVWVLLQVSVEALVGC
jgi:hypothetical protein